MAQSFCPHTLMDLKLGKLKANLPGLLEDMLSFSANESVTLGPDSSNVDSLNPLYVIAIALGVGSFIAFLVASLVCRFIRKRSGPVWISKIAHMKDKYSSMADEETAVRNDNFIIGFSNPGADSATDAADGERSVTVIGYRALDPETNRSADETLSKDQIPRDRVMYGKILGTGWFGKVYEGEAYRIQHGVKKTRIIIKELKENADLQAKKCFLDETKMFSSVEHTNLMTVFGHSTEKDPCMILLEYTPLGNLKQFLISHRNDATKYQEDGTLLHMALDIASGLNCLHSNNFFHRDISARNCIVALNKAVKIGDYGMSRSSFKNDYYSLPNLSGLPVPLRWLPPEGVVVSPNKRFTTKSPSEKGNVWSFGVTLWELVEFGRQPYEELTDEEVLQSVVLDRLYQLPEPKQQGKYTEVLYDVMKQCWLEPNARPSMCDVKASLQRLESWSSPKVILNLDRNIMTEAEITPLVKIDPNDANAFDKLHENDATLEGSHAQAIELNESSSNHYISSSGSVKNRDEIRVVDGKPNESKNSYSPPVAIVRPLQMELQEDNKSRYLDSTLDVCTPSLSNCSAFDEGVIVAEAPSKELAESVHVPVGDDSCSPPPVTYIGDPCDSFELLRTRTDSDNSGHLVRGSLLRSQSTDSTTSQDSVLSSGSEYVMLPGETTRRRSSLRQANYQSGQKSVHYPANILALRTVHRYIPEPEEDEYDRVSEGSGEESDPLDQEIESKCNGDQGQEEKRDLVEICEEDKVKFEKEPSSPVEKKIRKANRRQKLGKYDDEWTVTIADEPH